MRLAQLEGSWWNPFIRISPGPPPALRACLRQPDGSWIRDSWTHPTQECAAAGLTLTVADTFRPPERVRTINPDHYVSPLIVATSGGLVLWPRLGGVSRITPYIGRAVSTIPVQLEPWEAAKLSRYARLSRQARDLIREAGIPAWFRLALYPYQREGAIRLASGWPYVADEPGLGKTRQTLAAAAITHTRRLLVVCPPVVVSNWAYEARSAGFVGHITPIYASSKNLSFTGDGVVIVPDTLLVSREHLRHQITAWNPDAMIVDEAHRYKNAKAQRTRIMTRLARTINGPVFAASGTPMLASPMELIPQLKIVSRFEETFGGWPRFVAEFFTKRPWGEYVPKKNELPRLHRKLTHEVWTRRYKADVLTDLPPKSRHSLIVDADMTVFNDAHEKVRHSLYEWFDQVGTELLAMSEKQRDKEFDAVAKQSLRYISWLREAAGLCKIDAATEWIRAKHEAEPNRPLVVWIHHTSVGDALCEALAGVYGANRVGMIVGSTPASTRSDLVKQFQNGHLTVLICSLTAAGVGITLTAADEALMVETDWTPAIVMQAEDRLHRISQTGPVTITTLIAPDTLDETIQQVLHTKARMLDAVIGGSSDVSVDEEYREPACVIARQIIDRTWNEWVKARG